MCDWNSLSQQDRIEIRKELAKQIDPETAEVYWSYGLEFDPYLEDPDLPEEYWQVSRVYVERDPDLSSRLAREAFRDAVPRADRESRLADR